MEFQILLGNLTNPTLLFFVLGFLASRLKSDLEIPASSSKFISLYLLFAIGFKGGQELSHSAVDEEVIRSLIFGPALSAFIPVYTFCILKSKLSVSNAAAISSAYGSVSAVTFVAAVTFLEIQQIPSSGHMVAVMALMDSPAIIVGMVLMMHYDRETKSSGPEKIKSVIHHAFTNGSVLLIVGSLVIGYVADSKQAEGIKPFTNDIFKGFLAIFLLEMGMMTANRILSFRQYGWFVTLFAIVIPAINGCGVDYFSQFITHAIGDRLILAVLAASASYIAVPAAMRLAAPKADPGLYVPMALGVTFPFNITVGMPLYLTLIRMSGT